MSKVRRNTMTSVQFLAWALVILLAPIVVFFQDYNVKAFLTALIPSAKSMLPWMCIYFLNYLWWVPKGLLGHKRALFWTANLVVAALGMGRLIYSGFAKSLPPEVPFSMSLVVCMGCVGLLLLQAVLVLVAVGSRYYEGYYELKTAEARRKQQAAEAELVWLKSQLNPHFLFNTLNNISSLTQIDADKAQNSIAQLSDLLRYALYDSQAPSVPLRKEIEFMNNYVELMKLRCNESTSICCDFRQEEGDVAIAPLLYISLLENAFKHGVNARNESFVNAYLHMEGKDLVFECSNSVFDKPKTDRIGSGIGLENLRKRLELIYPGHYSYTVEESDHIYKSTIILKDICSDA